MKDLKHTKGDWKIKKINGRFLKVESNGIIISELESIMLPMYPTPEGMEANAKLISAAPELLEALQVCYRSLLTYGSHPIIEKQVEKALKKALE